MNGTASPGPRRWCSWVWCWSSPSRPAGPCDPAMAQPADARLQLETARLTALYGRRAVVKDVSILFPTHTVTALIGPSGCGKTTFLRCLNRMHELSEGGWITGKVLLLDEPTASLDPAGTQHIEELCHELKTRYTIVIVTHNLQQAARVSDYTGFFYLGDLVELGRTEELFTKPTKERTEAYITGRFG